MNFSSDVDFCRVDIWKSSGKWYATMALSWLGEYEAEGVLQDIFRNLMRQQATGLWAGMTATCLNPYHVNGHPLMIKL